MAMLTDSSVGLGAEATWGTPVTPTRWLEMVEQDFSVVKNVQQGAGLRVGATLARSGRRVVTTYGVTGSITAELTTKGFGLLWESCLGTGTSTLVSGSTYQQNFTLTTGTTLPGRTIQTGVVQADGTVQPVTYEGCTVSEWELTLDNDGIVTLATTWDGESWLTATAYAAPSYPVTPSLFHFGHGATGAMMLGGTYTAPTTTTLGSTNTAVTNVRSFKLSGSNGLVAGRYNLGGSGRKSRQLVGQRTLTGELEIEVTDTVARDAYLNDTGIPCVLTLTSTEALSTGFAQFSVALPEIRLNGEVPKPDGTGLSIISAPFDVLENASGQQATISHRTADTAL